MANLQMCGLAIFVRLAELSQIWQFAGFVICGPNFCGRKTFANTQKIVFPYKFIGSQGSISKNLMK
jgi:hypothetical protein